jgi:Zn finger protein HypA/HybF involved in hydrogenase expression
MECSVCHSDIDAWLDKFRKLPKIYLDALYFEENKVPYNEDEKGSYISGQKFIEIEEHKVKTRCPKCGSRM